MVCKWGFLNHNSYTSTLEMFKFHSDIVFESGRGNSFRLVLDRLLGVKLTGYGYGLTVRDRDYGLCWGLIGVTVKLGVMIRCLGHERRGYIWTWIISTGIRFKTIAAYSFLMFYLF